MPSHRIDRLNKDLKVELSALLRTLKDPDIDPVFVSVTRVEVTNDLSYAKVYISSIHGAQDAKTACETLKRAGGYLRTQISKNMKIRKAPALQFVADDSTEYFQKINKIIERFDGDDKQE